MGWEATVTWVQALPNGKDKLVKDKLVDDDFMSLCQSLEDFGDDAILEVHIVNTKKEVKCLQGVR